MAREVFPDSKLGEFFNQNFINVKIDMEKGEGIKLKNDFNISAFPTMAWVNYKSQVVHRAVGYRNIEKLLIEGKNAVEGSINEAELYKQYKKNKKNPEKVKEYLDYLLKSHNSYATEVTQIYLDLLPEERYFERDKLNLIIRQIKSPFSKYIDFLYENKEELNKKYPKIRIEYRLTQKYNDYATGLAMKVTKGEAFDQKSFDRLIDLMEERAIPTEKLKARIEILLYRNTKDWVKYVDKIEALRKDSFFKEDMTTIYQWYTPVVISDCNEPYVINKTIEWLDLAFNNLSYFSFSQIKRLWENKINLCERINTDAETINRLKIELDFLGKLNLVNKKAEQLQNQMNKGNSKAKKRVPGMKPF